MESVAQIKSKLVGHITLAMNKLKVYDNVEETFHLDVYSIIVEPKMLSCFEFKCLNVYTITSAELYTADSLSKY